MRSTRCRGYTFTIPDDAPLDKNATVLYGVQGYPTKIIINPEGRIHKIFSGEGPDFYKELDAVL